MIYYRAFNEAVMHAKIYWNRLKRTHQKNACVGYSNSVSGKILIKPAYVVSYRRIYNDRNVQRTL